MLQWKGKRSRLLMIKKKKPKSNVVGVLRPALRFSEHYSTLDGQGALW